MKPRKRGRSPNLDCEECLPISKRITRLNIQSSQRQSVDDKETNELNHSYGAAGSNHSNSINFQLPWQQNSGQSHHLPHEGNNNNCFPCGSHQCESDQTMLMRTNIMAYADQHQLPKEDLNGYKPDLSEQENPHYYQINSILYQAHLEKAVRKGSNIKP